jgi:Rps23 Pro-64 3,4-dihydroxylase Tpa1-like proline 4-hydroxylase
MTAKQVLDAFSETLMRDDRILSARERELLMSLLQNAKLDSGNNAETQSAVNAAIARSIGETVAQRAFTLLGGSIVERILAHPESSRNAEENSQFTRTELHAPQPPGGPQGAPVAPQPPTSAPQPPSPSQPGRTPQPPSSSQLTQGLRAFKTQSEVAGNGVGVLEMPATAGSRCVVLDEFLAPRELEELIAFTLQHEKDFRYSEVISPSGEPGVIDYNHRRSRVLTDLGKHQHVILERILSVLPSVLEQLGMEEFPVAQVEAQITASNDGDFFRLHSDDAQETIATRHLTFVYFFHRDPSPFDGGELRLHGAGVDRTLHGDSQPAADEQTGIYQTIVPQQNQIVFFPCSVMHEITRVHCSSRSFADSRFTLNGWLHR